MKIKTIPRATGLGDVVAKVAQPIAKAVDAVAGTNLANCGGCKRRQQKLNQKFPMKNILILTILLTLTTWSARALDWTYSTNLHYALTYPTNIYLGTNASDGATNGDTFYDWGTKLNAFMNLTQRRWQVQQATNDFLFTNAPSGGGSSGLTNIVFTNTTTLAAGSSATATNLGVVGGIAYFSIGIPAGIAGTNFVTVYGTSNAIENSQQILAYRTNKVFGASNYLARINGLYKFSYFPGDDGGNPPMNVPYILRGSYNGSNSWFTITNGFWTTNTLTVVSTNAAGTPGSAVLYSFQNWPALGRINEIRGQRIRVDAPTNNDEVATKYSSETFALNVAANNFLTYTATNGEREYYYGPGGVKIFGMKQSVPIYCTSSNTIFSADASNWLLSIPVTNFVSGWQLQFSPDIALDNGFNLFTNYTLTTNTGWATFTIPQAATITNGLVGFFRIVSPQAGGVTSYYAHTMTRGTVWPSNTFNLVEITNQLAALGPGKHYWTGSSNGLALVTLSYSNGVVRYVRRDE